jgi:hypothetical protein
MDQDTERLLSWTKRLRERAARKARGPRPRPDTVRLVDTIPACDLCAEHGKAVPAYAEAILHSRGGSWANVCQDCFGWGCCSLGLAKGQMFKLKEIKL